MHPYIHLFGSPFSSYSLMGILGFIAAITYVLLTNRSGKLDRLKGDDLLHIAVLSVLGALAGSKLLSLITLLPGIIRHWSFITQTPGLLFRILTGGFVFYGGLLGGLWAVWVYCKKFKISFQTTAALLTPAVPLFHIFGRIGCFLGGCCWGVENHRWGVVYPPESLGAPSGIPLLPVQLIEAACNLLLFLLLAWLARRLVRKGLVLPTYLFSYGIVRFVLEFFRGDAERGVWLLSTSQWISLVLVLAVLCLYLLRWRKSPASSAPPPQT